MVPLNFRQQLVLNIRSQESKISKSTMTRRSYSIWIIVLILGLQVACEKAKAPPNIIIFLADDLGYGDLACYGNPIIQSPNIDHFATQGVRMTDFHSGGTVCSPSRAALLTGRNPYRSGFFYISGKDTYLRDDEITIAELLRNQGYETSFWGKWHLSKIEKDRYDQPGPGDQGFDYWMGTSVNAFDGPENANKFVLNGEPIGEVQGWYCDVIVDRAGDWLRNKRQKDKPFFMFVSTHEPHTPISPPDHYSEMYNKKEIDSLENLINYGGEARPTTDLSDLKKEYYGTVSQLDAAFGNLMKTLDELDLDEKTLVIFTSDNGPETPVTDEESLGLWFDPIRDKCFGTPGNLRGMKRFPYEGGHRVPGIVRYPGIISPNTESAALFNGTDILPTVGKLTGFDLPNDRAIDGIEAFPALHGKIVTRNSGTIWFYPNHEDAYFRMPQVSFRKDEYTLIGWLPKKPDTLDLKTWMATNDPEVFELYDIVSDPSQKIDLAKEKKEIVNQMKVDMNALWREMRDEGLATKSAD